MHMRGNQPSRHSAEQPGQRERAGRSRSHSNGDASAMKRVLLVDDSPIVVERVREAIGEIDNLKVVDTAQREHTAVEVLSHGEIDIVVLDLHLDWGTGFGVLRALLGMQQRRPRVIVFTTYDLPEYRRQAMALGADHFLDKARDFERLLELLHDYSSEAGPAPTVQ
jgi:DNA-binding NarL/FixJ family response regulator